MLKYDVYFTDVEYSIGYLVEHTFYIKIINFNLLNLLYKINKKTSYCNHRKIPSSHNRHKRPCCHKSCCSHHGRSLRKTEPVRDGHWWRTRPSGDRRVCSRSRNMWCRIHPWYRNRNGSHIDHSWCNNNRPLRASQSCSERGPINQYIVKHLI